MSPSVPPRTTSTLSHRLAVVLTTLAVALLGLPLLAGPAAAAPGQRIELRVLVLDGGGASERAIAAQLAREGVPATRVDLTSTDRPRITPAFLAEAATSTAHFQGVVLPSTAPAQLDAAELTALATYERTYGIREVAANVYPGTEVSPAFTGGVGTPLDGGSVTPTAAALADGFGQLNGAAFRVDDFSPTTTEAYGTLGAAPVLSPGETFTPFLNATVGASSGWLAGVYARDGREQLLVSAAYNENQQWFGQFAHGVVSWLTRGIALGHQRAYFAVHVDDVFLADSRWSVDGNCTPGDDCVGDVSTPDIRMTPADVTRLVQWQNANDFKLDMVYNAWGTQPAGSSITPTAAPTTSTDPLTQAFLASQDQFPWINHTYSHPYLGCIQIAPTVVGQTWRCAAGPTDAPRQDAEIPAQASGGLLWASQAFLTSQVRVNAAWGRARGLTDFDPTELVTGEHSGLASAPQQPTDNPFLAPALTAAGIRVTASDNSRETGSRTVGSAVTMPRYPMNVYYNAGTYQDQIDEYNWYYTSRANGGGGICEANPATSTCITPLPAADQAQSRASFDGYLAPLEVRNALSRVLGNDPRPFYAHQSNLAEDGLLYPVVSGVLSQYRATHATSAPLVRTDMTTQAQVLARQTAWATAQRTAPVGYVDAAGVHVPSVAGVAVPLTVPASSTAAGLESYGGQRSGWFSAATTVPLATPLGGYGGSAEPVAPSSPVISGVTPGAGSATVSWTVPSDLGGSAIRGYTVTAYAGDATTATTSVAAGSTATSVVVPGLTNGTPYTFAVTATNGAGTSVPSARSLPVTPVTVPAPPPSIDARSTVGGATVSWVAPTADGGTPVTGYRLDAVSAAGTTTVTVGPDVRNGVVTGLTPGTSYRVTVTTLNAAGASAPSPGLDVTAAAAGAFAGAPTGVTAIAGEGSATVNWTAPAYPGTTPVTGYVVIRYDASGYAGETYTGPVTSAVVTGLVPGVPLRFLVIPINADRSPHWSAISNEVTPLAARTAPTAPTVAGVTASSGQLQVTWAAPTSDGGSPVTGYVVTVYAGSGASVVTTVSAGATDRTATVTGLVDGSSYSVAVTATNALGSSPSSARSATVTPVGLPGAPTITSAVPGDSALTLGWTAPVSTGGSPVTGYEVRVFSGTTLVSTTQVPGGAAGTTVTGLAAGTPYTADVAAVTSAGTGARSARSAIVVPVRLVVPAAPAAPTVAAAPSSLTVTWQPPAANGGPAVSGYTVTVYQGTTDTVVSRTPVTSGTSVVVGGLVNGTAYTVTVAATNSVGTGPASTRSAPVRPAPRVPGAPALTGITAGTQALTVAWVPPTDNGGASVSGYTVTVYSGTSNTVVRTVTAGAGATSAQVGMLQQGQPYSATVAATNSAGTGAASARSATVTPVSVLAPPSAPTITGVTPGVRRVTVTWTPPATTGLFGVSGYTVTVYSGTSTTVVTTASAGSAARSATVTGLTTGRAYTVTVTPRSLLGTGSPSARSASVTAL